MSRYVTVNTDMWNERMFRKMPRSSQDLYMYLFTCPESNQAGFFRLPAEDLEARRGKEALDDLIKGSPFYMYDAEYELVFLPQFLKYNAAKTTNQITGVNRVVAALDECDMMVDFYLAFLKYGGKKAVKMAEPRVKEYVVKQAIYRGTKEAEELATIITAPLEETKQIQNKT